METMAQCFLEALLNVFSSKFGIKCLTRDFFFCSEYSFFSMKLNPHSIFSIKLKLARFFYLLPGSGSLSKCLWFLKKMIPLICIADWLSVVTSRKLEDVYAERLCKIIYAL